MQWNCRNFLLLLCKVLSLYCVLRIEFSRRETHTHGNPYWIPNSFVQNECWKTFCSQKMRASKVINIVRLLSTIFRYIYLQSTYISFIPIIVPFEIFIFAGKTRRPNHESVTQYIFSNYNSLPLIFHDPSFHTFSLAFSLYKHTHARVSDRV